MKSKLTIKDIAKELSVSISTVSKALNNSNEISTDTSERIKAFAAFHNYKPNSLALKLRSQKTLTIGVVFPTIVHYFFSTVLRGIDEYANDRGYNVMVCLSNASYKKEILSIDTLIEGSVDGILLSLSTGTQKKGNFSHIKTLIDEDIPLVLFDSVTDNIECDKVTIDDELGALKATEYLIETGCKKIALITNPDFMTIGLLRTRGYIKALHKHNIVVDERLIIEIDEEKDTKEQIGILFEDDSNYPDGVLAINGEIYASTAMQVAKGKGLQIPKDISIITFTDGLISRHTSPRLTSLVQHGYEMGKQAVELLIDRIENKATEIQCQKKVISTKLKIRESTKALD